MFIKINLAQRLFYKIKITFVSDFNGREYEKS